MAKNISQAQIKALVEAAVIFAKDNPSEDSIAGYAMGMCHAAQVLMATPKELAAGTESPYVTLAEDLEAAMFEAID